MEKKILNYINSLVKLKEASEDGKRRVFVTISTKNPDRSNDVVEPRGAMIDRFKQNPVVLYAHKSREYPIATAEDIQINDTTITATVVFPKEGEFEHSDIVFKLIKNGLLNAWSIGFMPLEWAERKDESGWGYTFTKWELLEFSAVPVPDNPEALTIMRSKEIDPEAVKKLLGDEVKEEPKEDKSIELQKTIDDLTAEIKTLKEGRVLSDANRQLIQGCLDGMGQVMTSLQELMNATQKEEPKSTEPEINKSYLQKLSKTMKKTDKEIGLTLRSIKNVLSQTGGEK